MNGELAPGWPLSKIGRPAEAIYLTDRTDLDALTIGPDQRSAGRLLLVEVLQPAA